MENMETIDGLVVNDNETTIPSPNNWVSGIYIEKELAESIKKDSIRLGEKAAETVYSENGRRRSNALVAKIEKKLKTHPFMVVRPSMVIYNLKDPSGLRLEESDSEHARLLGRAIGHVTDNSVNAGVNTVNAFKLDIQNRGFAEGFRSVVNESPFKGEKPEDRPWYLKPQSTNIGNF